MNPDRTRFASSRGARALAGCLFALAGPGWPLSLAAAEPAADWPWLRLTAESLSLGDVTLRGASLELRPDGAVDARFAALETGPGEALLEATALAGRLDELAAGDDGFSARGGVVAWRLPADWALRSTAAGMELRLAVKRQPLALLEGLPQAPEPIGWLQGGRFDAAASFDWPEQGAASWAADVSVAELGFDSPDGRFAGQGLAFRLRGRGAELALAGAALDGRISGGELLVDRLYRNFEGTPVEFDVRSAASPAPRLTVRLSDPSAVRLDAVLDWSAAAGNGPSVDVRALELDFPGAYERYIEPIAAAWDLDGLSVTGRVAWQGAWRGGSLDSGDLDVQDLSVVDTRRGRFALTGLETTLRPGNEAFDSRLGWRGLLLGKVNLGAGRAVLGSEPGLIALREPLTLDVMGGQVRLNAFRYALPGARPAAGRDTFISASLADIELLPLTRALGWPEFGGRLNGELPGAHLEDGVLTIDGGIRVQVFDGLVSITDLSVERLFGVLPSLAANIELRDLDLEQLTETFSFGRIGGRVDGYVHDLRMLDWEPVAFDAWLGTPDRQRGTNGISRQAVSHLTSIGGGGPTAALSGPMLRLFNNFTYRRLGLGCRLADYICEIRGLGDDGQGVLLLEGAGVPRITIRAYNRHIDWPQMIANLGAISEGESIEVNPGSRP